MAVATTEKKSGKIVRGQNGGARPGAGRPKGVPNKLTADVKSAIFEAFERAGGVDYLVGVAQSDPKTFCALIGKVIPLQVGGEGSGSVVITWRSSDEE